MGFDVKKLVRKEVFNFEPYLPGKPIDELKRELGIEKIYKLASNENSIGRPKKNVVKIQDILENIHRYPDSVCFGLREKVAKKLGQNTEKILFGNGSDEIIELLGKTFLNDDDEIIVSKHSFVRYKMSADLMGATTITVEMTPNFVVNLEKMFDAITEKTKLIFIGNPNNPTGTFVEKLDFEKFIERVPENVLVIMDEAYYEFATEDPQYPETLELQKKYKNIVVLRTFSKIFGLAGLRVGYMIADPEIVGFVERVRPPFNVNSIAQIIASISLDDKEHLDATLDLIRSGKKFLYEEFKNLDMKYLPTSANFILFKTKIPGKILFQKLLQKGIIIRAVDEYELQEFARVTIGTPEENKAFIKALKEIL